MTTEACKNVIGLISQYVHPMKAQFILENFCKERELPFNEFSRDDLPEFILFLAKERDNISAIDDKRFFILLSSLVSFSNSKKNQEETLT